MRIRHCLHRLLASSVLGLIPFPAYASGLDVSLAFESLIFTFAPLWIITAVLVLVIAGFALMMSQDEGRLDKAKKTIAAVVIGGIIITIILAIPGGPTKFVSIMYTGIPGFVLPNTGGIIVSDEAIGISQWLTAMAAMFGIFIIIVAVFRAVASLGGEGDYTNARLAILHIIGGLIIIAGAFIFQLAFFGSDTGPQAVVMGSLNIKPNPLIGLIASKILIVLAVITTIAVAILIYAGFRMIISFGQEDQFTAAKSLAYRVAIGLIVILVSYALVIVVALLFNPT